MAKKQYSEIERRAFAKEALNTNVETVANKARVSVSTVRRWITKYHKGSYGYPQNANDQIEDLAGMIQRGEISQEKAEQAIHDLAADADHKIWGERAQAQFGVIQEPDAAPAPSADNGQYEYMIEHLANFAGDLIYDETHKLTAASFMETETAETIATDITEMVNEYETCAWAKARESVALLWIDLETELPTAEEVLTWTAEGTKYDTTTPAGPKWLSVCEDIVRTIYGDYNIEHLHPAKYRPPVKLSNKQDALKKMDAWMEHLDKTKTSARSDFQRDLIEAKQQEVSRVRYAIDNTISHNSENILGAVLNIIDAKLAASEDIDTTEKSNLQASAIEAKQIQLGRLRDELLGKTAYRIG